MDQHEQITKLFIKNNLTESTTWPNFNHNATYDWIIRYSKIPWLKLNITVPVNIIHKEIEG